MKSIITYFSRLLSNPKNSTKVNADSMKYNLDSNEIRLLIEPDWIRVNSNSGYSMPLHGQTANETNEVIKKNYRSVVNHYKHRANDNLLLKDIEMVSLRIVLRYFNMYNHWRFMYKREKNRDLTFLEKDFEETTTYHVIIAYFMEKYPKDYTGKCKAILNLTGDQFTELSKSKYQYETK